MAINFPLSIGSALADHRDAFNYLLGMITLALTEEGWEVEGSGSDWVHWVKGEKQIYIRGWPREGRYIPLQGQNGVTLDELDAIAQRISNASGWTTDRAVPG